MDKCLIGFCELWELPVEDMSQEDFKVVENTLGFKVFKLNKLNKELLGGF